MWQSGCYDYAPKPAVSTMLVEIEREMRGGKKVERGRERGRERGGGGRERSYMYVGKCSTLDANFHFTTSSQLVGQSLSASSNNLRPCIQPHDTCTVLTTTHTPGTSKTTALSKVLLADIMTFCALCTHSTTPRPYCYQFQCLKLWTLPAA